MNLEDYLRSHTQKSLAELINITPGAISHWVVKNRVPAERVLELEIVTNGLLTRKDLRPDLYSD